MASQGATTGVAATSVVELGDATNPQTQQQAVDTTGAARTQPNTIDPSGIAHALPIATDQTGRVELSDSEKLSLILTELRLQTAILAMGFSIPDDLDQMRQDASLSPFDS